MTTDWKLEDVSSQKGKIAIVTGANVGLGYETAKALAQLDMEVVMACRNLSKGEAAKNKLLKAYPQARLRLMSLDLGSMSSVRKFASNYARRYQQLDLLVNNAGVMMTPYRITEDGFEQQLAINYLGHFLLTGLLLPQLEAAGQARVVSLSSLSYKGRDIYFDDLFFKKGYSAQKAYGQSKMACLMYAYELQRRLQAGGHTTLSLAAHPGISQTNLTRHLPGIVHFLANLTGPLLTQSAAKGALPTLRAALDDNLKGGEFLGPDGLGEFWGKPVVVDSDDVSKDPHRADRLWQVSEELTGIHYLDKTRETAKKNN
ncbi:MAG: oxidoreductase [Cyclobacteriaceae bacterium]